MAKDYKNLYRNKGSRSAAIDLDKRLSQIMQRKQQQADAGTTTADADMFNAKQRESLQKLTNKGNIDNTSLSGRFELAREKLSNASSEKTAGMNITGELARQRLSNSGAMDVQGLRERGATADRERQSLADRWNLIGNMRNAGADTRTLREVGSNYETPWATDYTKINQAPGETATPKWVQKKDAFGVPIPGEFYNESSMSNPGIGQDFIQPPTSEYTQQELDSVSNKYANIADERERTSYAIDNAFAPKPTVAAKPAVVHQNINTNPVDYKGGKNRASEASARANDVRKKREAFRIKSEELRKKRALERNQ